MKKILVSTDFSEASHKALRYAVEFAKTIQGKIVLFHVFTPAVVPVTDVPWTVLPGPTEVTDEPMELLKKELQLFTNNLEVPAECYTTEGDTVDKIIELEEEEKPDFIVMGMKPAGVLREYLIGSVATSVIRKSQIPVLLIPELYLLKKIEQIVFACDYKIDDVTILSPVKEVVKLFNARLIILNIAKQTEDIDEDKTKTGVILENYFADTKHIFHFVEDNNLLNGLNNFIEQNKVDMIATVGHHHNLIEILFRKDTNRKIAFHTIVPLFIVPVITV